VQVKRGGGTMNETSHPYPGTSLTENIFIRLLTFWPFRASCRVNFNFRDVKKLVSIARDVKRQYG
jgi:hypothetical protein